MLRKMLFGQNHILMPKFTPKQKRRHVLPGKELENDHIIKKFSRNF